MEPGGLEAPLSGGGERDARGRGDGGEWSGDRGRLTYYVDE